MITWRKRWCAAWLALLFLVSGACGLPRAVPPRTEPAATAAQTQQPCVVIDAGHQQRGDPKQEPLGPGASETKPRVSDGTAGRFTGIPEYELNLAVSRKLQALLEQRGYRVVMTRTEHDVNLSNRERAELAAREGGDIFVRIHANGSQNPATHGAMTICMTQDSPFNASLYPRSSLLSQTILDCLTAAAGCARERVWETDTMAGINWSTIPVTIVELGYMTNEAEDRLLATDAYRDKLASGIADGIDRYFAALAAQTAAEAAPDAELAQLLRTFLSGRSGEWDICTGSLTGGPSACASANLPADGCMVSASLIKLFIAGAVYRAVEQGALRCDAVSDEIAAMITVSDNGAANRLVRLLGGGNAAAGMERVNAFAQGIGCTHTRQNRLMLEQNGLENYTSAADCAIALRMIYAGTYVNQRWSEQLLQLLLQQTVNNRLPKGVPAGTPVAHKTGDLQNLSCGDVGIVYGQSGAYLLCVINNHAVNDVQTAADFAELSGRVYRFFNP